jgi:hypothetical protein
LIYIISDIHIFICCPSIILSVVRFLIFDRRSRRVIITTLVSGIGNVVRRLRLDASKRIIGYPGELEGPGAWDFA